MAILLKSGSQFQNYVSLNKRVHLLIHCFIIPWKYNVQLKTETNFSTCQPEEFIIAKAVQEIERRFMHVVQPQKKN